MKSNIRIPLIAFFLALAAWAAAPSAHAKIFWNGPNTNYTQNGDQDVIVPGAVAIDRGINSYIFNAISEGGPGVGSPLDTEWAVGTPDLIGNLSDTTITGLNFIPFGGEANSVRTTAQGAPYFSINPYILGGNGTGGPITFVVHLINEDTYFTLTFRAWGQHFVGGFSYDRSTPSAGPPPPPPPPTPSVTITSPANNAVFSSPANVEIDADATVSSGTVTNVTFFRDTTIIGTKTAPPFTITASGLPSGSYALTAVATAAGVSATSPVVNISVVAPSPTPSVTITNPVNNAVFAAPADVRIGADATVSSGTITNVTFFRGATAVGTDVAPPFTITASALPNGNYALTAVAIAAGISSTSSIVNISVVTPVTTSLAVQPATLANNQFSFSYSATPGLRYEVDVSSNLLNWTPLVTNVAPSNPAFITNNISGNKNFYRVGRLPNP
jgi:hypothetical protein